MMNNEEIIKKIKMNIAVSNFKTEINSDKAQEEHTLKNRKRGRVYEMKKRIAIIVTSIILTMSSVALAFELFSGLDGDELSLGATYEGEGIVSIYVENKSNKTLNFEKNIKLMRWSDSEEIKPISNKIEVNNTKFSPNSSGIMKIDISEMYDLSELEKPLNNDDYYYFVLTNNNFMFGNDWHCSIEFCKNDNNTKTEISYIDKVELDDSLGKGGVNGELEEFYKEWVIDSNQRNEKIGEYYQKVEELLSVEREKGKNIISSINPWLFVGKPDESVIFDDRVSKELQYQLISENHSTLDAFNIPVASTEFDDCMVLSTIIPQKSSQINSTGGTTIPLVYIFQYDAKELQKRNTYVFIRGKLYDYNELEQYKVYQDDKYVSYNVTDLFYTDLDLYVETYTKNRSDIYMDEGVETRIKNIYNYYMKKENLEKSLYYHK